MGNYKVKEEEKAVIDYGKGARYIIRGIKINGNRNTIKYLLMSIPFDSNSIPAENSKLAAIVSN